jgi:hypothetical protein
MNLNHNPTNEPLVPHGQQMVMKSGEQMLTIIAEGMATIHSGGLILWSII